MKKKWFLSIGIFAFLVLAALIYTRPMPLESLCEADITSKNEVRKKRFLENFRMVREKLTDLKERDYKRLLQPVIDGNEIMEMFSLQPCREVGQLKQYLKDAVLDNRVPNEREPLMALLLEKAKEMGLAKN